MTTPGESGTGLRLGHDPLRDHLTGCCGDDCGYCAKRRRIQAEGLEAVARAAWRLLDEGGEHPTEDGLHVVSSADWQRTSDALDALEASGWVRDNDGPTDA